MFRLLALLALLLIPHAVAAAFDHRHAAWNDLLAKNVVWIDAGHASQVRYAGFESDRAKLKAYLDSLSAVTRQEFDGWSKTEQLAFLINAYNAFTIEKVLTRLSEPQIDPRFRHLRRQPVEGQVLHAARHADEPRRHRARHHPQTGRLRRPAHPLRGELRVGGLPGAAQRGYVADRLDAQLEDQTRRFLSDRSRNRYVPASSTLEVSKIFDWYGADFKRRKGDLVAFFAPYALEMSNAPEAQQAIRDGKAKIAFLDYDWALNDVRK